MKRLSALCVIASFTVIFLSGCPEPSEDNGNVVYVVPGGAGLENGTSWANAYADIQDAVDRAEYLLNSTSTEYEVWVKEGDYTECIVLYDGAEVFGSFDGTESVSSDWDNPGYYPSTEIESDSSSYHVVTGAANSLFGGFSITGGNANGSQSQDISGGGIFVSGIGEDTMSIGYCSLELNHADGSGGGVFAYNSSIAVITCRFDQNSAGKNDEYNACFGGGLCIYSDSSLSFGVENCWFIGNSTYSSQDCCGGGLNVAQFLNGEISDCYFDGNEATSDKTLSGFNDHARGGGIAIEVSGDDSVTLSDCEFVDNIATDMGGGVYAMLNTPIESCVFKENSADYGGGLWGCPESVKQSYFYRNHADFDGGGAKVVTFPTAFENCVFAQNEADGNGGGLFAILYDTPLHSILNCTFTKNKADADNNNQGSGSGIFSSNSSGVDLPVTNSIIYGNYTDEISVGGSDSVNGVRSVIPPSYQGTGSFYSDPLFVDPPANTTESESNYDLSLQSSSTCVNYDTSGSAPAVDIEGTTRPVGSYDDIGAYESY